MAIGDSFHHLEMFSIQWHLWKLLSFMSNVHLVSLDSLFEYWNMVDSTKHTAATELFWFMITTNAFSNWINRHTMARITMLCTPKLSITTSLVFLSSLPKLASLTWSLSHYQGIPTRKISNVNCLEERQSITAKNLLFKKESIALWTEECAMECMEP